MFGKRPSSTHAGSIQMFLPQLKVAGITIALLMLLGTIGFRITGGPEWTVLDGLYMTALTISTVGFHEVHPLGPEGRIVAMLLIFSGVGTLIYVTGSVAEAVIKGRVFWRQRVINKAKVLSGHYIVCGFGRVGQAICRSLRHQGVDYVAISLEDPPNDTEDLVVVGDATDDATLITAGIKRARGLVAVLGNDAANIYCVLAARALKPDLFIMARCSEERSASKLRAAGAQRVINPYERGGVLMAQVMLRPEVVDYVEEVFRGAGLEVYFEEVSVAPDSTLAGQTLRTSPIRPELDIIVTAIVKSGGWKIFNPPPDERIDPGDVLIVLGRSSGLDRLRALAQQKAGH